MKSLLAQTEVFKGTPFRGFGKLGLEGESGEGAIDIFAKFISSTIGLLTIIAIIWFIFVLFTGAIGMMSAGGDKTALETSRKRITSGLIGFIVVVAGIFIVDLTGRLLGIPDILNIQKLFETIVGK